MNNELNTTEQQKDSDFKSFAEKPKQFYKKLPKWAKFLIWVLVIFIAIKGVSYTFSAERLEKRLEGTLWYSEIENQSWHSYVYTLAFDKEDHVEYGFWRKDDDDWQFKKTTSGSDWAILEDKTMLLGDEYLEFAKDWELSGGKLYIKTGKYEGVYSKTKPW